MGDVGQMTRATPIVGGQKGQKFRFTVLTDGLLRYEWAPDSEFEDRPSAFAAHRDQATVPEYRVRETDDKLEIITSRFHMTYDKQEFSPSGFSAVVSGYSRFMWQYGEEIETLGGTYRTLDSVDGRIPLEPGVVAERGFATIDDSHTFLFTEDGFITTRRPGPGRVDGYLFCYGHDYRGAVKALYTVSGPQPLLPRWTLGNWWSRYYEYSADSYIKLMDTFRQQGIPLSVAVIDMDWHLVDDPIVAEAHQSGWTGYTWNRKLFPDPPAFVDQLHKRNLRVTLNEHPAEGVHSYEDQYYDMAKALQHDVSNKDPILFDITDRNFMNAYLNVLLKSLEDDGVDFWWVDWQQGEHSRIPGIDPLWVLNHFHYIHNAELEKKRGGGEPIIFSRYAGPGSHRYPVGFSGDTVVSWDSLAFQPEFTASASNIGYGWWSHDIGGHMFGVRDDDLTARWVQLGVLSPIMRLHSTKNNWMGKEPWKLPAGSGQGPRDVVTNFLRLRHRLIPYLYTMNVRAAHSHEPLVQPMYWEYPERAEAYRVPNQYLFGTEMMVVPITSPQNRATKTGKVKAWLPPGTYVDFFTGVVYDGDREMWLSRTLDKVPVLLKQGSIVPLDQNPEPENGDSIPSAFEVVVAVGADGHFEIVEEDETRKAVDGSIEWVKTPITFNQAEGAIKIGPTTGGTSPKARGWSIRLLGIKTPKSLHATVDGSQIKPEVSAANNGLVISVGDISPKASATIQLGPDPQLDVNDSWGLMEPIVDDAQISYTLKEQIEANLSSKGLSKSVLASRLEATDMDSDLRLVLSEFLFADNRS